MKEFNFNSQVCTDKNQSERLLALGLKKETADMYLQSVLNDEWSPFVPIAFPYSDRPEEIVAPDVVNAVPAWSLHRIMSMVYSSRAKKNGLRLAIIRYDNPFEDMIQQIEWLIKEGYFNKEYLV